MASHMESARLKMFLTHILMVYRLTEDDTIRDAQMGTITFPVETVLKKLGRLNKKGRKGITRGCIDVYFLPLDFLINGFLPMVFSTVGCSRASSAILVARRCTGVSLFNIFSLILSAKGLDGKKFSHCKALT